MHTPSYQEGDLQVQSILNFARATMTQIKSLDRPPASAEAMYTLVNSFIEFAAAYFDKAGRLIDTMADDDGVRSKMERRYHRNQAVEKLASEWAHILPIVQSAVFTPNTSNTEEKENDHPSYMPLDLLGLMVEGARVSLKTKNAQKIAVVPHFGRQFGLVKFKYAPDVQLIGVPVTVLQTPGEWSVIWHELASLVVSPLESPDQPNIDDKMLLQQILGELPKESGKIEWTEYETYLPDDWNKLIGTARPEDNGWDVFWEHWQKILDRTFDFTIAGTPLPPVNWRRSWLEELAEDACCVLTFGPMAYQIFVDIFTRQYEDLSQPKDHRHPPPLIRLEVAYQLIQLMAEFFKIAPSTITFGFDPLEPRHGKIPGAREIASWLWSNQANLVSAPVDWRQEIPGETKLEAREQLIEDMAALFQCRDMQPQNVEVLARSARRIVFDGYELIQRLPPDQLPEQIAGIWLPLLQRLTPTQRQVADPSFSTGTQSAGFISETRAVQTLEAFEKLSFSYMDPVDVAAADCWTLWAGWVNRCVPR